MNKVFLLGRVTRDIELKKANDKSVCEFTVACPRDRETSDFITCTAWGKTAETCAKYLGKGSQVVVSGKITSGKYEKDGKTVYTTKVFAEQVEFVGAKKDGETAPKGATETDDADMPF